LLGIEGEVAWATPGSFTVHNFPCSEDGKNCAKQKKVATQHYQDPSTNIEAVYVRLEQAHEQARLRKQAIAEKRALRA